MADQVANVIGIYRLRPRPFFRETMASHGEQVGEQTTPKTDFVSVLRRRRFVIKRIDCVVECNRLRGSISRRRVGADSNYSRTRSSQVVVGVGILLKACPNHLQAGSQCTMVARGPGRVNDKQRDTRQGRHADKPYRQVWNPTQHRRRSTRAEEHLNPCQHSIQAREILLTNRLVSDLGCEVETDVMPEGLYRRGGGGGGAKFVSDFCPKSPGGVLGGGGAGLGGGGGGDGRGSLLACHVGSLIQIAPRVLDGSRGCAKSGFGARLRLVPQHSLKCDSLQSERVSGCGLSTVLLW